MQVVVLPTAADVSAYAADLVADAVRAKPDLVLGLATGRTPLGLYARLARMGLDWSRARFFHLDECWGTRIFKSYLRRYFFDHINARRDQIFWISKRYEEQIRRAGGIDLQILGIGMNGHIGFNEPGSGLDSRTRVVELASETRSIYGVSKGITMGIATILEARNLLMLATGEEKAFIVDQALKVTRVPASAVRQHSSAILLVDRNAGKMLKRSYGRQGSLGGGLKWAINDVKSGSEGRHQPTPGSV